MCVIILSCYLMVMTIFFPSFQHKMLVSTPLETTQPSTNSDTNSPAKYEAAPCYCCRNRVYRGEFEKVRAFFKKIKSGERLSENWDLENSPLLNNRLSDISGNRQRSLFFEGYTTAGESRAAEVKKPWMSGG